QVVDALRAAIAQRIASGSVSGLHAIAEAAATLASIDPTRPGMGGLRLRLELALLAPPGASYAPARPESGAATVPAREAEAAEASARDATGVRSNGSPRGTRGERRTPDDLPAAAIAGGARTEPDGRDASRRKAAASTETTTSAPPPPEVSPEPPTPVATETPGASGELAAGDHPRASGTRAPAVAADGDALSALREQWPEIVAYVSAHPPTKPLISACRPISVEGDVVTLGFPEGQAFLAEVARKRGPQLEAGIGHFLGRPVIVRCVATNVDLAAGPIDADGARLLAEARRIFADDLADVGEVG
ncbi:MAG TPA: hypothetical protein VEY67_08655, partial [Candidatus Dormibacteraeota bacterium]|nr:hypothetical protein [Candidatus Dormibacteraeota bacterium]